MKRNLKFELYLNANVAILWNGVCHLIAYNLLAVKPKHILATKAKRGAKKKVHIKASDDDTDSENENQNKDKGRPPNSKNVLTRQ